MRYLILFVLIVFTIGQSCEPTSNPYENMFFVYTVDRANREIPGLEVLLLKNGDTLQTDTGNAEGFVTFSKKYFENMESLQFTINDFQCSQREVCYQSMIFNVFVPQESYTFMLVER